LRGAVAKEGNKLDAEMVRDQAVDADWVPPLVLCFSKVRYIGVSNETSYGVMQFAALAERLGLPKIVSIQNSYSLLVRTAFETDLAETCAPRQVCPSGLP
jgi:Aldo/keto reductase family